MICHFFRFVLQPETIVDPEATKPEDWDDEEDGEWQAPVIPNPEYKGEWKPKQIENPQYKGKWVHPEIDNPDYVQYNDVYKRGIIGGVGIEVWQVKSGTVFSDFIVADSVKDAEKFFQERQVSRDDEQAAKNDFEQVESEENEDNQDGDVGSADELDDIDKDEL